MDTFIPASSPLFTYTPCKACNGGFQPSTTNDNSTAPYSLTTSSTTSIALNFTGTGITYTLTYPALSTWTSVISVNGTALTPDQSSSNNSIQGLPWGTHQTVIQLNRLDGQSAESTSANFQGASIDLGYLAGAGTTNVTVDDTAWRAWKIDLSPGWNMLEREWSNWINTTQIDQERSHQNQSFNGSISWTEQVNATTSIEFIGSAVWAYGITGGEAGSDYEVQLDGKSMGIYNASGGPRQYGSILYHTSGLQDFDHVLTLRNLVEGKRLSVDYLESLSGLIAIPTGTSTSTDSPSPAPSTQSIKSKRLDPAAIAGISVGAALVGIGLLGLVLVACIRRRKLSKMSSRSLPNSSMPPNRSYWRWSSGKGKGKGKSATTRELNLPFDEKSHPWQSLHDPLSALSLGTATYRLDSLPSSPFTPPVPSMPSDPSDPLAGSDRSNTASSSLGTSFLKMSKSPKRIKTSIWAAASSEQEHDRDSPTKDKMNEGTKRKTAIIAALTDTDSPLSNLKDSYLPKLSGSRYGRERERKKSPSVGTVLTEVDERPATPGGILDGFGMGHPGTPTGRPDGPGDNQGRNEKSVIPSLRNRSTLKGYL